MNSGDPEPDRKPDAIEEPPEDAKTRVSDTEPDSGAPDSEVGPRANNGGDFGEELETKESDVKVETPSTEDEEEDDDEEADEEDAAPAAAPETSTGSPFNSLLSEFDDFVANEQSGQMATSRALRYGFEAGDMVWGKVKSHPWWPGHVYNDALATPQVRRTRREGHVLVAFFGDSSYGWFDPAEFIPFDPNFSDKSRQTSSRNFARALDEAVDEACRRRRLGLVCKCRSPYSFRPADVPGYFIVDVPDYEPNGIYSAKQIQKSRDSFKPREALGFIKNLALSPCSGDDKDLEFAKNRATVVAYRKAVFEEFDVTYAQAFGVQPGRPARDRTDSLDHKAKQPPRAPLSGPLVIAETLGSSKSTAKQKKVKDGSKKDKYLLKRRDESDNSKKSQKVSQGKVSSSAALASADGSEAEKPPTTTLKPEIVSTTDTDSSSNGRETIIADQELVRNSLAAQEEVKEESRSVPSASDLCHITSESLKSEEFQQPQSVSADQVQDGHSVEAKLSTSKVKGVKKTKVKRPREELDSEDVTAEGKKKKMKKKKKQQPDTETGSSDPQKPSVPKKKVVKKRVGKKSSIASDSLETLPLGEVGSAAELDLPRLLTDLQVLALDPCHGIERSSPAIVRRLFLRFRTLVYQKSLVSQSPESENAAEPPVRDIPSQKPAKPSFRSEDPTISGRKRAPSDRQEEIAAKRSKKVTDIKTLASEKKSNQSTQNQKAPEPYRSGEGRETAVPLGRKTRPDSLKKPAEPTILVMKFPPKTSLPSPAELKARFARFGPMDQSGLRVFWKSSTCRVVFLHKFDAQAACKFASGNSSLFGSPGMRCFIKDFGAAGADTNEPTTAGDSTTAATTAAGDSSVSHRPTSAASAAQLKSCLKKAPAEDSGLLGPGPRGTSRVKFMLAGEESGAGSRVETGLAGNRNNNISASFGGGGGGVSSTSTTSVAKMDFSVQKVNVALPPPPPPPPTTSSLPIIPLHTQFSNNSHHSHNNAKVGPPRNTNNSNTANIGGPPISDMVDISQQMLSLLTRCNDVVANVSGMLGYVPFHPL